MVQCFIQMNLVVFILLANTSHLCAMSGPPSDKESDGFKSNSTSSTYNRQNLVPEDLNEEDDTFEFCDRLRRPLEELEQEQRRLLSALIPPDFEEEEGE